LKGVGWGAGRGCEDEGVERGDVWMDGEGGVSWKETGI
jgi:hypothetical protein